MNHPKQIKPGRRWIHKLSGKALTDVGYNITLDSALRGNGDYNIRTIYRKSIARRQNFEMMEMRSNFENTDSRSSEENLPELRLTQAIDELGNFKQSSRLVQGQGKGDHPQNVSWTHHFTDRKLLECFENDTVPFRDYSENDLQVYENFFYGCKHWNFFCVDEDVGAVILSLKMEILHGKQYVRLLVRSSQRSIHVLVTMSSMGVSDHYMDPYGWIDKLTQLLQLSKPLQLITHHTVGTELIKLDRVFVKSECKIGLLYVKHGQKTEEEIFSNTSHSPAFETFLRLLGDHVTLKGFTGYSGGLDTSNGLNGSQSVYTTYQHNKIMFHVSTLMPNTSGDLKHLGKKRHIGNDVLCVVFTDETETIFSPTWIKSQFIHAYLQVQVADSTTARLRFKVSVFCRDEVPWFGPNLPENGLFEEGNEFREWFLKKVINGDRACYQAPKFASVQQRTRSQKMNSILEKEIDDLNEKLNNRICTPSSSPSNSLDSLQPLFPDVSISSLEDSYPKLQYFNYTHNEEINSGDITFLAGKTYKKRIYGVRSVMCRKSRVFRDMLTDWAIPRTCSLNSVHMKEDSLVKLALKKARTQSLLHNHSRKGKFALEMSSHRSPNSDEHVTTTSIKKEGQTYEVSLDCIGRAREFIMNEFEADIFSGVIDYIHNDKCSITYQTLPGLLCAATYYELPELRLSCLNRLDHVITVETVCPMLNIVEEYIFFKDGKELQRKLLNFFVNHSMEIIQEDLFTILSRSRLILVLSQDWKGEIKRKIRVVTNWAKRRDILGWQSLAKSVLDSCGPITETALDEVDLI